MPFIEYSLSIDDCTKNGGEELFTKVHCFFDQIPIDSLKIRDSNAVHLGEKFLAAILSAIDLMLQKGLDRALFSNIFIREVLSSVVRASFTVVAHSEILQNVAKYCSILRFFI